VIFADGTQIRAEVAESDEARARGLMFRDVLAEDAGMLLKMERPGYHPIWMKNVRVPLDILWLDARGRVVWMVEWAPPCACEPCPIYTPEARSVFVLEVAGGVAGRHGAAVGGAVALTLR
jgi:uncharacterized membrane protein (UPF0127 family)